ncbi:GTP-binding protein, putative [Plasmodium relictum]|uniref:GTPase Der n=1 Tax=Plasmodium relictum TaxID=85471 RepID=A0A1J1HAU3_PLARL|nr:GTP-binding protein, putative [Plasmodium relictum]CRH02601.1 GTP-binding protein, putative [Plasmodium relictum]
MKFKLKYIITFFISFLSCYNSYIIKSFNQPVEKNHFYYNKKKKFSSPNYFSYIPFINEYLLKKKVYNFKIFLNNKKTEEKDNFEDLNSIQNAILNEEAQLNKTLEKKYIKKKKESYISNENETKDVNKKNNYLTNKNKNVKKAKKTICNFDCDFVNEYSDNLNKKNKEKNSNLKGHINDDDLYKYANQNNKNNYNCEYTYPNNNNNSFEYNECVKGTNEIGEENNEMKKKNNEILEENNEMLEKNDGLLEENNEMLEKNDEILEENNGILEKNDEIGVENNEMKKKNNEILEENNSRFSDNNGYRENTNEKKKKKKNMEIKIVRNLPLISIIGRPNVGKSTIFNRLTRKFQKGNIVLDTSSTRDKVYGEVEWDGYKFEIVDTGGLVFEDDKFSKEIRDQILLALNESSVVLLVVDGLKGIDPLDTEICKFLRKYIREEYKKAFSKGENEENNVSHNEKELEDNEKSDIKKKKENNPSEILCEKYLPNKSEKLINNAQKNISYNSNTKNCYKSNKNGSEIKEKGEGGDKNQNENKNKSTTSDKNNVNDNFKNNSFLKVIVCVNKCESYKDGYYKAQTFWELGFGNPFACSGIHGNGLSEILDECIKYIKKVKVNEIDEEEIEKNTINISFIGKPNTGKSSILNKILNCNRFIVSPLAGTTVDSIDVLIKIKDSDRLYRLIDTAGIQKRKKNVPFNEKTKYEYLLYNRTEKAIRRSDVCILVIDSFNGISSHDINIARKILQENKSCIICCNKWDLIHNKNDIFNDTKNYVLNLLKPIDFADILFISAKTSQRLLNIFEHAEETYKNYTKKVNTNSLNQIIKEALLLRPPVPVKNKSLKIYYAFQAHIKPPGFVFFCNSEKSVYLNYTKYLESRIRETFSFKGTPIKIYYKQRRLRNIVKKVKNPDKYNLDIEAIQKNFQKMQESKGVYS